MMIYGIIRLSGSDESLEAHENLKFVIAFAFQCLSHLTRTLFIF